MVYQEEKGGTNPLDLINGVFQRFEMNLKHRRAQDVRVMIMFAYALLNARDGGTAKGDLPEDLQHAFDIVSGMFYLTDSHPRYDTSFAIREISSLNLSYGSYLEIFQTQLRLHSLLFFDKQAQDSIRISTRHGSQEEVFFSDISSYENFLCSHLDLQNKRILDLDGRYSLFDDLSRYKEYRIIEEDKYFRTLFILRKYLEGWNHVSISDRLDAIADTDFDFVKFSWNHVSDEAPDNAMLRLMDSSRQTTFICQTQQRIATHSYFLMGASLDEVVSISTFNNFASCLYISRPDRAPSIPITFVDGERYKFWLYHSLRDNGLKRDNGYFYSQLLTIINDDDNRYVTHVHPDDIDSKYLAPGFYLIREELKRKGPIPLSSILSPATMEPADQWTYNESGQRIVEGMINNNERLNEVIPEASQQGTVNGYYVSSPVLLIGQFVGYYDPIKNGQAMIQGRIAPFTIDESVADWRFVVKYLNEIASEFMQGLRSFKASLRDIIDCIHLPKLTLSEQREIVDNHLRNVKVAFLKDLDFRETNHQVLVVTPGKADFERRYAPEMDRLGMKVLQYVESLSDLESIISKHKGAGVPASQTADAVLADANMNSGDLLSVMFETKGSGIPLYFFMNNDSEDGPIFWGELEPFKVKFKERLVKSDNFLQTIKTSLNAASNNFIQEYSEFFAAAKRFDEEHPDWDLCGYAAKVLSSNPINLNLEGFRPIIDKYIGGYLRENGVVPDALVDDGAIPDFFMKPPYEDNKHGIKVSLYENLDDDTKRGEAWIRSAYVTIRKLCNASSHNADFKPHPSVGKAAFFLFMEIVKWLDRDEIRDRYQSRKFRLVIERKDVKTPVTRNKQAG